MKVVIYTSYDVAQKIWSAQNTFCKSRKRRAETSPSCIIILFQKSRILKTTSLIKCISELLACFIYSYFAHQNSASRCRNGVIVTSRVVFARVITTNIIIVWRHNHIRCDRCVCAAVAAQCRPAGLSTGRSAEASQHTTRTAGQAA